jgi:superkiller protein 3
MSAAARNRRRGKRKSTPNRRRLLLIAACLAGTVLAAGLVIYHWRSKAPPAPPSSNIVLKPPSIDLARADPAVAKVVSAARTAVLESPRSAAAWGKLGMVFYAHSSSPEAGVCFAQAERLDTLQARWPYFQAIILAESDPDTAIRKLQRTVALCGDVPDAPRLRLGEALLGQARLGEAQEEFQQVLQRHPDNARAHLGLARLSFLKGDLQNAHSHLVRSAADRRTQKASRILLAQTRERLGNKLSAQEYRQTAALPDDPEWADPILDEAFQLQTGKKAMIIRAGILYDQRHFPEAIALSRRLVQEYPDSDTGWLILGRALVQQKDLSAAQEALQKVLQLAPDSVEAHFNLGYAAYLRKDYRAAATWYRKATELKPDFTFAYHDLGHCLILLDDRAGAIAAFRAALRCQPDLAGVHEVLGELLMKEGQYAEAVAHAGLALQLNPTDAAAKKLVQRLLIHISIPIGT